MKRPILYLVTLFSVLLLYQAAAQAAGGHDSAPEETAVSFRLQGADINARLTPSSFEEGSDPVVLVTFVKQGTATPLLDVKAMVRLTPAQQQGASTHEGMAMEDTAEPARSDQDSGGLLDFGAPESRPEHVDLTGFHDLTAQQQAGTYGATVTAPEPGTYRLELAITSLQDRLFSPPLTIGSDIAYLPASKYSQYRLLFTMGLVLVIGLLAIWLLKQRQAQGLDVGERFDLLQISWLSRFMHSMWYRPLFQIPSFLIFLLLIYLGLFGTQQGDRSVATMLMWTIWWAAIIFAFVLAGRIWCMACPIGALQDWVQKLGTLNKRFPRWLRNIWLSSMLFFLITWWDSFSGIVNRPALTAWLLIGFFVVATVMALIFRGRTFCRYLCPIGGLIGIYSMFSPIELRNRSLDVCRADKEKACLRGSAKTRACPMFVSPMSLDRNNYCNMCGECFTGCRSRNIVLRFRSFAKDLWASRKGYLDEAFFVLVILGLSLVVTAEMVEPWHIWMDALGGLIPFETLGITSHAGQEKFTFTLILIASSLIIPAVLLWLTSLSVHRLTGPEPPHSTKRIFIQFAYMFIPIGLSMHLAHNVLHLLQEGPMIIPAVQNALNVHLGMSLGEPQWSVTPLIGQETMYWLQMALMLILDGFALYAGYRIAVRYFGDKALRAYAPMALLAIGFMVLNVFILGQPMSHRHTH